MISMVGQNDKIQIQGGEFHFVPLDLLVAKFNIFDIISQSNTTERNIDSCTRAANFK